jgi:hypothetical protein
MANPMLAQRAAQNLVAEQGLAQMAQQRQAADQMIAQTAAAQRGVAFQAANANMGATLQNQQNNLNAISGLGQGAMAASGKKAAHGMIVPGEAEESGDTYENDSVQVTLSPGEVVVPRSAAQDPEKLAAFVEALKKKEKKGELPKDGIVSPVDAIIKAANDLKKQMENK